LAIARPFTEGRIVAKKTTKAPAKKSVSAKPAAKEAAPEKPAAQAAAPKPKMPTLPPKPVPPHQQFLDHKGVKPHAMTKARIIRHQGR
jgi:hypothetical protein